MRKKVLNFLLKDSLNSKVQTTSDLYKNITSKEMIKKVLFWLYALFLLLTSLSYLIFKSYCCIYICTYFHTNSFCVFN